LILAVALVGIAVNLAATWTLAQANRQSLNVEGSYQHILTDLYAFIGTAIAAAVILATGFERADPIVSLLIAGLMLRSGYALVKASARIFLEAAPEGVDPDEIGRALAGQPGVVEVHDLHVWEVTSGFPACPRTSWSTPTPTATPPDGRWTRCSATNSTSSTRRSKSTTKAATCSTSSHFGRVSAPGEVRSPRRWTVTPACDGLACGAAAAH
jgi:hypothetical protein